jgi:DNA-3-methyladenine glycosylase II
MPPVIEPAAATRHLIAADPVMGSIIAAAGTFAMREDGGDPFRSLARSIIFQQLSGKAAGTIFNRFAGLFDGSAGTPLVSRSDPSWSAPAEPFPAPAAVLGLSDEAMRSAGLSRQKVASLRSLAEHFAGGELSTHLFDEWDDEEIIAHLTRVRGVGRWTAEMFLMFHLGRPDVLPVNDVGINRAIQRQYGLDSQPKPDDVQRIGQPWRPWATVACWYLWRSEDVRVPGA